MKLNKVINGDCLEVLKSLEENSIDSIVTDPPYELGFMGKSWDNMGIAYNAELWKQCFRVLKPGGHLLAFSGTRTYHRMAVAIEDAGFEVRDMIEWVYGSGFPKSLNIGKAVDKLQGNEREVVGSKIHSQKGVKVAEERTTIGAGAFGEPREAEITKGNTKWEGWGTALKPAHEPICMARKPLAEKTVAENVLKWGTGGINIDESRVEFEDTPNPATNPLYRYKNDYKQVTDNGQHEGVNVKFTNSLNPPSELGRFPANLIHDNSEEVRECFPQSSKGWGKASNSETSGKKSMFGIGGVNANRYDMGGESSARFFKSILYYPKASKSERNKGCEELEKKRIEGRDAGQDERNVPYKKRTTPMSNTHPTVKPIALMEYLIKMVTFEGGVVLDPFAGSGTTLIAAKKNGYQYIGIEKESEYIEIINARLNDAQLNIFEL